MSSQSHFSGFFFVLFKLGNAVIPWLFHFNWRLKSLVEACEGSKCKSLINIFETCFHHWIHQNNKKFWIGQKLPSSKILLRFCNLKFSYCLHQWEELHLFMKCTHVYKYPFFGVIVDVSSVLTAINALPSLVHCKALSNESFRLAAKRFQYVPLKCDDHSLM